MFSTFNFFTHWKNHRQAEDNRRDEEEAAQAAAAASNVRSYNTQQVLMPYDDSFASGGRLLGGSQSNYVYSDVDDQISTCSCTCLGGTNCANHELLIDRGYHPSDILSDDLNIKRASV